MKREWPKWAPQDVIDEWEIYQFFKEDEAEFQERIGSLLDEIDASIHPIAKGRIEKVHKAREALDEYVDFAANNPDHDIIYKMLTDWRMKEVWNHFRQLDDNCLAFAELTASAYMQAIQVNTKLPPKKAEDNTTKIKKKARELSALLENSVLDGFIGVDMKEWLGADTIRKMLQVRIGFTPDQIFPSPSRDYIPPKLSYLLRKLADDADQYKDRMTLGIEDHDVQAGRPGRKDAPRVYFSRFMTKRMVELTGDPQRKLIHPLVQVIFDLDENFEEGQLSRVAPVSDEMQKKSEKFRESLKILHEIDKYERNLGLRNPLKPETDE